MPKRTFALEPGGQKCLGLSWEGYYKNVAVTLGDEVIGVILDREELNAGWQSVLPDGTVLHIQYVQKFLPGAELRILRDGQPLPGSDSDPEIRFKKALSDVFFFAVFYILLGVIAALFHLEILQIIGIRSISIIFGLAILLLGFFAKRRWAAALIAAILIIVLDTFLWLVWVISTDTTIRLSGLVIRACMIASMVHSIGTMRALKQLTTPEKSPKHS